MMDPEELDETEDLAPRSEYSRRGWQFVPDFTDTPYWVRTFYWVPLIGGLAKHWMRTRGRYRPTPPSSGEGWDEDGVREFKEGFGVFDEPKEDKEEQVSGYEYIHLRDAKIYAPGQNPLPANGLLWRGRLSSVGGFSYGVFGPAPDQD